MQDGFMVAIQVHYLISYKVGRENDNYLLKIGVLLAIISTFVMILRSLKYCKQIDFRNFICLQNLAHVLDFTLAQKVEMTLDEEILAKYDVETLIRKS